MADAVLCVCVIDGSVEKVQLYIAQNGGQPPGTFHSFQNNAAVDYQPFCDDFGPMSISSTIHFIRQLEESLEECVILSCSRLVYSVLPGRRSLSNAAVLLGSYMILKKDMTPDQVADRFLAISPERLEDFRDATHMPANFGLTLRDVWDGLYRGKQCTWIDRPSHADCPFWGQIDIEEYENYDNPANGDLHELVPGKLVAFRGPRNLGGAMYADDPAKWTRKFSPVFYIETFEQLGVTDVVRLNTAEYDAQDFEEAGIRHHDLFFEDCTEPPGPLVAAFLSIVDGARGAVAVHCKAGLGRTGTLIAVQLMRAHGFTARAAMGWLRLMRPGSVIGEQQDFLCTVQRIREEKAAARRAALLAGHSQSSPDLLQPAALALAAPASAGVWRGGPSSPWAAAADAAAAETAAREQAAHEAAGQLAGALDLRSAARMHTWRAFF
jgi:cell division cycle 14